MMRDSLFLVFVCLCLRVTLHAVKVNTANGLINLFSNKGGVLKDNIELTADLDFSDSRLTLPLGASKNGDCEVYSGVFQGNGHSIKGLGMNNTNNGGYNHAGLFCKLRDATIENLVIDSSCNFTGYQSGGLTVTASGSLIIRNVRNEAFVSGQEWAGGLIGYVKEREKQNVSVSFENCVNNGTVFVNGDDTVNNHDEDANDVNYIGSGGFVGYILSDSEVKVTFSSSINYGNISGMNNNDCATFIGGFAGAIFNTDKISLGECNNHGSIALFVKNCSNNGHIKGSEIEKSTSAGFIGIMMCNGHMTFEDDTNSQSVEGGSIASGFLGGAGNAGKISFSHCTNDGNVSINYDDGVAAGFVGGIYISESELTISNCTNNGNISGTQQNGTFAGFVGGIYSESGLNISNCQNNGNILGNNKCLSGGFIGQCFSSFSITQSHNSGTVRGGFIGGFIGTAFLGDKSSNDMRVEIKNCQNNGTVDLCFSSEDNFVGGFIGYIMFQYLNGNVEIDSCNESGHITSFSDTGSVGGMIGKVTFRYEDNDYHNKDGTFINQVIITSSTLNQEMTIDCQGCAVGGAIGNILSENPYQTNAIYVSVTGYQDMNVTCKGCSVGGLIGTVNDTVHTTVTITGSSINGSFDVTSENMDHSATGGLIGSATNNNELTLSISNSMSNSTFSTNKVDKVGGIIGTYSNNKNTIEGATLNLNNVQNYGNITSTDFSIVGGIIGFIFNIQSITVTGCSNHGNVSTESKVGTNSVVGGIIGSFTDSMNIIIKPTITIENNENYGTIDVESIGTMSVGGIVGSIHDVLSPKVIITHSSNNGLLIHAKTKSVHIGGLIGNVTNNGDLTLTMSHCSNNATLNSPGDSSGGGLVGEINGNAKYNIQITECTNHGNVITFGKQNSVSGLIGSVGRNRIGTITLESLTNNGKVSVKENCYKSYLGGVFGSVVQNPQMDIKIQTSSNYGTVETCGDCQAVSGGLCGFIDLVDDGISFTLKIENCINSGSIISSKAIETTSCGLFCVSSESFLSNRNVEVKNSVNKGEVVGKTTFGIGSRATSVENVVSMGVIDENQGDPCFSSCPTAHFLFVLSGLGSSSINGATVFYKKAGHFITKDGLQVDELLNEQAMDKHFQMVWDKQLYLTKGIHVQVSQPVDEAFVVVYGTKMERLKQKFDNSESFYYVNDSNHQVIVNSTEFFVDTIVLLCHNITFEHDLKSHVLVQHNKSLKNSIPSIPAHYLNDTIFSLTNKQNKSDKYYDDTPPIVHDVTLEVKAACDKLNKEVCQEKNITTCMVIGGKCKEKSVMIPVIVVCSVAALLCIGAAIFVMITWFKPKNSGPGSVGLLPTVKVSINGKKKLLLIDKEIGRGKFGIVFLAHSRGIHSQYAVKIIQTVSRQESRQVDKEVKVMEHLDTQFVVVVYGSLRTKTSLTIAMEYCASGSLQTVLDEGRLQQNACIPMLLDIAKAMAYLHSQNIIHRDLKPGNVLVFSTDPHDHPMAKFVSFISNTECCD